MSLAPTPLVESHQFIVYQQKLHSVVIILILHDKVMQTHFDEGFYARQQGGEVLKSSTKVTRGKSPSERFSEEELMKFSTRISTQV